MSAPIFLVSFAICADRSRGSQREAAKPKVDPIGTTLIALGALDFIAVVALMIVGALALSGRFVHVSKRTAWALTGTAIGIVGTYLTGIALIQSCRCIAQHQKQSQSMFD